MQPISAASRTSSQSAQATLTWQLLFLSGIVSSYHSNLIFSPPPPPPMPELCSRILTQIISKALPKFLNCSLLVEWLRCVFFDCCTGSQCRRRCFAENAVFRTWCHAGLESDELNPSFCALTSLCGGVARAVVTLLFPPLACEDRLLIFKQHSLEWRLKTSMLKFKLLFVTFFLLLHVPFFPILLSFLRRYVRNTSWFAFHILLFFFFSQDSGSCSTKGIRAYHFSSTSSFSAPHLPCLSPSFIPSTSVRVSCLSNKITSIPWIEKNDNQRPKGMHWLRVSKSNRPTLEVSSDLPRPELWAG